MSDLFLVATTLVVLKQSGFSHIVLVHNDTQISRRDFQFLRLFGLRASDEA